MACRVPSSGARRLQPSVVRRCPDEEEHRVVLGQGHPLDEPPCESPTDSNLPVRACHPRPSLSRASRRSCNIFTDVRVAFVGVVFQARRTSSLKSRFDRRISSRTTFQRDYRFSVAMDSNFTGNRLGNREYRHFRRLPARSMITRIDRGSMEEKGARRRWDTLRRGGQTRDTVNELYVRDNVTFHPVNHGPF